MEPIEISIDPKKQVLRLSCGQCGDVKDIQIQIENNRLRVSIYDAIDLDIEDKECVLEPVHIIV